jgi:thermitase
MYLRINWGRCILLVLPVIVVVSILLRGPTSTFSEDQIGSNDSCGQIASVSQTNDPYCGKQWAISKIKSLPMYSNLNDQVIIGLLDSGVDRNHEDLAGKIIDSINFSGSPSVNDVNGHGTHVAGIIAANIDNGIGIAGAAPNTKLLNVKVAQDDGVVWAGNLAKGIIWAVDHGARIVNISLSVPQKTEAMEQAVKYAADHHVLVVAAAGNSKESIGYPASLPEVIAVSALYPDGSTWADEKTETDACVHAPGIDIYSTLPNNRYGFRSGNSMATAYFSAIAALTVGSKQGPDISSSMNFDIIRVLKSTFSKYNT